MKKFIIIVKFIFIVIVKIILFFLLFPFHLVLMRDKKKIVKNFIAMVRFIFISIFIIMLTIMRFLFVFPRYMFPMYGIVTDAKTGEPVEGAVAMVDWDVTWGLGETHTDTIRSAEKITDSKGRFVLPGAFHFLTNPPTVVIYKKGYIAWRSDHIFPSCEKQHFIWKIRNKFQLKYFDMEKCLEKYPPHRCSRNFHVSHINSGLAGTYCPELSKASGWEGLLGSDENSLFQEKRKKMKDKPKGRDDTWADDIWSEVLEELYGVKKREANE